MQGYCFKDGMSPKECENGAYWERNMLALRFADGWYNDTENNWDGWHRVLSLDGGKMCFHIPDDFEVGNLPEIKPTWDGHTTEEKWNRVAAMRGLELSWPVEDENLHPMTTSDYERMRESNKG